MATPNIDQGGYDYEFLETPSDTLICQICHFPSREPHLSTCCGHIFCKSCLEAARRVTSVANTCPVCRSKQFSTFPNLQTDRLVRNLHVYCSNRSKGCEWQGEVNAITDHLSNSDGCQFHEVNCPNDCGMNYQRQHLTSHVETECPRREVNCQYCQDTGEHQFIEGQHKEECSKLPLPCPNTCGVENIPRDGVTQHIDVCALQQIQCKYHVVGCEAIMARKDHKEHYKQMMEEHLSLSVTELATTKVTHEKENQNFKELLASQQNAQNIIEKLTNELTTAKNEIAAAKHEIASAKDEIVALKQALDEKETKLQLKVTTVEAATQKRVTEVESKVQSIDMMVWCNYLFSEATKLLSGVEVLPVVVKMSEFAEKRRQKMQWCSDPFFTHSNGYKMYLSVSPDGDVESQSSHMSVSLYIMRGPHDGRLDWPMKGEYEVKLLNQFSNCGHHQVTHSIKEKNSHKPSFFSDKNSLPSWHSGSFIPHAALATTNQFLKDDTLYFKVSKIR